MIITISRPGGNIHGFILSASTLKVLVSIIAAFLLCLALLLIEVINLCSVFITWILTMRIETAIHLLLFVVLLASIPFLRHWIAERKNVCRS